MDRKRIVVAGLIAISFAVLLFALLRRGGSESSVKPAETEPAAAVSTEAVPPLDNASAEIETSLPMFHRLNETYMRGAHPAHGGVGVLKRLGVKTVVDLRSAYDVTDEVRIAAEREGLRYSWMPMSVWNPPSDDEANRFIKLVKDDSGGPFFVFCTDGLNRTGELSAIYRIMHDGWSADRALKEMDDFGFNPYYYTLRNYVWAYARKFRPAAVPRAARSHL